MSSIKTDPRESYDVSVRFPNSDFYFIRPELKRKTIKVECKVNSQTGNTQYYVGERPLVEDEPLYVEEFGQN